MDQRPRRPPDSDVGMLERMLGGLDWDTLFTPGATAAHSDTAEQNQGTKSHPISASVGHERSQDEFKDIQANASRSADEGQHGEDKQAAEGPNSDKMQQMRARHREAQARYRAKHREQKSELEGDIKRIKRSIDGGSGELHRLKAQKSSLVQRLSSATAALQATLEISKLLPVNLSDSINIAPLRLQGASPAAPGSSRLPGLSAFPSRHVRANPSAIFQPVHPPRPSASSSVHCIPVSHEPILQASSGASGLMQMQEGGDPSALVSSLQHPSSLSISSSMPTTTSNTPPNNGTLRSLLHQLRSAEAVRLDATPSEVTWFAQMAVEVAPGTRLSYTSTLMTPECVASNVLSGLLCRLEFALASALLRVQRSGGGALPADIAAARGDVLAEIGAVSGLDSPNNPTTKRRRFDVASGDPSNIMSRSYGSLGSIPFAQGDASHNAYGDLAAPGGAFGTGAPIQQPFATSSAADAAEAMASGPLSQRGSLQQRTRSLSLTKERMELMRVRCGVNGTHPMRAAVKAAYRTIVARYAAPGRLPMHEITRVLEKVLEKEETVLRSLWEAQVERQGPGAAGEALKLESAANDASTETDVLLSKLAAVTATPIGMGTGLHHRSDRGLRLSEGATSWGPGGEEQAFYEASSEHMIATLVSARAEMMRLLQELPLKAPSEGASAPPVFDEALQDSLLATATAQAIGTSLAITDATDIVLQLRIDSMLPLMSTTEVDTTHTDLYKTLALSEPQKHALAEGWKRWQKGKQSLSALSSQAHNFLNSLPHELTIPPIFLAHLSSLATMPSQPSSTPATTASDANMPLSLAMQQLPRQSPAAASAEATAAAAAASGSLPLWASTPATAMQPGLGAMAAPSSRAPLLGGPSGQIAMSSDMQLQLLMQGHIQGGTPQNFAETLSPWPSLQLDDVCGSQPGVGGVGAGHAGDNPFAAMHGGHSSGIAAGQTHHGHAAGIHAAEDVSLLANSVHCRCSKSLLPGCFGRFLHDASALNSGMQYIGQCSGHMSCAAQGFQDLLTAHRAEKEHIVDALDLQVPNAILTVPQVTRVASEHILQDSAPLDFLALCQLVSSQQHRQALFRHPFFHC